MNGKYICVIVTLCFALCLAVPCLGQINPLLTLSAGYGQSYGGLGVFGQLHPIPYVGLHAGVGYFPASMFWDFADDVVLGNLGIKIYAPLDTDPLYLFVDAQYGGLGVEATEEYYFESGWGYYYDYYEKRQEVLVGPSVLAGGEIRFEIGSGIAGGFGAALGLAYVTNDIPWSDISIIPTLDLGLSLYLLNPQYSTEH